MGHTIKGEQLLSKPRDLRVQLPQPSRARPVYEYSIHASNRHMDSTVQAISSHFNKSVAFFKPSMGSPKKLTAVCAALRLVTRGTRTKFGDKPSELIEIREAGRSQETDQSIMRTPKENDSPISVISLPNISRWECWSKSRGRPVDQEFI